MYRVIVSAGTARSMIVKSFSFFTKEEAVVYITTQLNKILNNPEVKQWNISMQEGPKVRQIVQK